MKQKEVDDYDDADSWEEKYFNVGGKERAQWGNGESDDRNGNENNEESKEEEEEGQGDV